VTARYSVESLRRIAVQTVRCASVVAGCVSAPILRSAHVVTC
jgi:hypothetical protein